MTEQKIKIASRLDGRGTVELNGRDITKHVHGIDVRIRAGRPTEITIYMPPCDTDIGAIAAAELVYFRHAPLADSPPLQAVPPEDVEVVGGHWIVKGHVEHDADCPGCRAIRA